MDNSVFVVDAHRFVLENELESIKCNLDIAKTHFSSIDGIGITNRCTDDKYERINNDQRKYQYKQKIDSFKCFIRQALLTHLFAPLTINCYRSLYGQSDSR